MHTGIMRFSEYLIIVLTLLTEFALSSLYLVYRYKTKKIIDPKNGMWTFIWICQGMGMILSLTAALYLKYTAVVDIEEIIKITVMICGAVLLCITDYYEKIIPNQVVLSLLIIRSVLFAIRSIFIGFSLNMLTDMLLGGIIGGGVMLVAAIISKGGVGGGDVKMMAVAGLYFGVGNMFTVMITAFLLSAIYGIYMITIKKAKWKDELPMAPFVCGGVLFCDALICLAA